MKKLFALLLGLMMLASVFTGCGSDNNAPSDNPNTPPLGSIDNPDDITPPDDTTPPDDITTPDDITNPDDTTNQEEFVVPEGHALVTLVNGTFADGKAMGVFPIGSSVEIYAPEKEGELFVCWKDHNGVVRGRYNNISLYVGDTATVTAEYQTRSSEGELYFDTDDGKTYYIAGIGTWKGNDLVIPETYNGKPVTYINADVFTNNTDIVSLTIPGRDMNNMITIPENAFDGCSSINNVVAPYLIRGINTAKMTFTAFYGEYLSDGIKYCYELTLQELTGCENLSIYGDYLRKVILPEKADQIERLCISGEKIKSVTLPAGIEVLEIDCPDLAELTVPESVKSIEIRNGGISSLILSDNVNITDVNIANCPNLTTLKLPKNLKEIGRISQCTSLTSIEIPDTVKIINGFYGCTALEKIDIPANVTAIGEGAFANCSSLKSVTIPFTSPTLGARAFENCTALTEVYLPLRPSRNYNAEDTIFKGCTSLKTVNYPGSMQEAAVLDNIFDGLNVNINYKVGATYDFDAGLRYISFGDGTCYVATTLNTEVTEFVIPKLSPSGERVVAILPRDFQTAAKIIIEAEIENLYDNTFLNNNMQEIRIPATLKYVGDDALDLPNVKDVYITDVEKWCQIRFGANSYPLQYADNLYLNGKLVTDIVLPDTITVIPAYAFSCNSLTSITIPDSVMSIEEGAFVGCEKLTSVIIPDSVTYIADGAFSGCNGLTSIRLPVLGKHFGTIFGYQKTNSRLYHFTESVRRPGTYHYDIVYYAYLIPEGLKNVILGENVTAIGEYAFNNCVSLEALTITGSVNSIGYEAFDGSEKMKDIYFDGTVEQWNAVEKHDLWNDRLALTVHCIDGDLKIE